MNKTKAYFYSLIILCVILLSSCGKTEFATVEEIKLTPARWEIENEFIGFDYSVEKGGVLVTNNGSNTTEIRVLAKYYDDDNCFLSDDTKTITLDAGDSWFVFFDMKEDAENVKYSATTDKPRNTPVSAVDIEFEFEDDKVIATNKSDKNFRNCAFQYVYYNSEQEILYVKSGTINDGYISAGEKASGDIPLEYPKNTGEIADIEINTYASYG